MRLETRILRLEAKKISDPVILHFADGSTQEICGSGDVLLRLFSRACGGADLSAGEAAQLDLIPRSVQAEEPGGGHMVELLRCFLSGPVEGLTR